MLLASGCVKSDGEQDLAYRLEFANPWFIEHQSELYPTSF